MKLVNGKPELRFHGKNWSKQKVRYAHRLIRYAVDVGSLHSPDHCQQCGTTLKRLNAFTNGHSHILAHHEDYNWPYHVVWLCDSCHYARHMTAGDFSWSAEAQEVLQNRMLEPFFPGWTGKYHRS